MAAPTSSSAAWLASRWTRRSSLFGSVLPDSAVDYGHGSLSVSMLTIPFNSSIIVDDSSGVVADTTRGGSDCGEQLTTMIATCNPSSLHSKISLATVINSRSNERGHVVKMQYAGTVSKDEGDGKPTFSTVCLATTSGESKTPVLLALDTNGSIHGCSFRHQHMGDDTDRLLDMKQCNFGDETMDGTNNMPIKRGKTSTADVSTTINDDTNQPLLKFMNNLNAMLESEPIEASLSSTQESTSSSRKRKLSPSINNPGIKSGGVLAVASSLTNSILPSDFPPIVMYLERAGGLNNNAETELRGLAWRTIPGLEEVDVPMTHLLFASKAKCGATIWEGLLNAMMQTVLSGNDAETDASGVIMMGFQDGSLRASLVRVGEEGAERNQSLKVFKATTLLQLADREPLISLQLVSPSSNLRDGNAKPTVLVGVGALGSIIALSSINPKFTRLPTAPFVGRLTSVAFVGCEWNESLVCLSYLGTTDARCTFLHRVIIGDDDSNHLTFRAPLPRTVSAIYSGTSISSQTVIALSSGDEKVVLLKLDLSDIDSLHNNTVQRNIEGLIRRRMSKSQKVLIDISPTEYKHDNKGNKLHSLIQKIESVSGRNTTMIRANSTALESIIALREIRETTNVASGLVGPSPRKAPVQCEVEFHKKPMPGVLDLIVSEAEQMTARWSSSVHILQSCTHALSPLLIPKSMGAMIPICYRRALGFGGKLTRVVYGGTATSYSGVAPDKMTIGVPMNDMLPVSIFASLNKTYEDDDASKDWKVAESITSSSSMSDATVSRALAMGSGSAIRASTNDAQGSYLGLVLPFDVGTHASPTIPLACTILIGVPDRINNNLDASHSNGCRELAEKMLQQWYQTKNDVVSLPMLKEGHWMRRSVSSTDTNDKPSVESSQYCCSGSLQLMDSSFAHEILLPGTKQPSQPIECVLNTAIGPVSFVSAPSTANGSSDLGFAIGSCTSPGESMALLSLVRQSVIRKLLEHKIGSSQTVRDDLKLLHSYHGVLSEKPTAKIAKYVYRSSEAHLAKNEATLSDCCKIYEILRAVPFTF